MEFSHIEEVVKEISIDSDRKYWMVRTMGGDHYKEFVEDGFIAIGYNEITLNDLKSLPLIENSAKITLAAQIESKLGIKAEKSNYPAGQLLRFYRDIKVGDVIIVPSRSSHLVSFGIVTSDLYEDSTNAHSHDSCQFIKRKKVEWKLSKNRGWLNPSLQLMFNSRHIISNVDGYAQYIDSLMNGFYVKDDEAYLTLRINSEEEITTSQFYSIYQIFDIVDKFCQKYGIEGNTDDIIWKIQMESPGDTRLISKSLKMLGLVGFTIIAINGGGFKMDKYGIDLSTKGLIGNYNEYLDKEVDRNLKESIRTKLDSLKLETPKDFEVAINLLDTQNSIRNNY